MSNVTKAVVVEKENDFISYELVDVDKYQGTRGERFLTHSFIMDSLRKTMGRTLTIIDATIVDKQQNKATKDLLRAIFSDEMEFAADWGFDQEELMKDIAQNDVIPGSVTVEEALGVK